MIIARHLYITILATTFSLSVLACRDKTTHGAASTQKGIRILKDGLTFPWDITLSKDGYLWMTEREGKILRIDPSTGKTVFSFTINEVESRGEGGLLGMALHPHFLNNGLLYVVYDYNSNDGYREKLVCYTYTGNALVKPIVLLDGVHAAGIHNGSRLWITDEASPKIFMSTGDASNQSLPQQTNTLNGKILRVNIDGTIPSDNPFPNNPVWSFGHRNPQGLVLAGNILYASEHGPNEEDEVNIIEKGRNYGWPNVEGPCNGDEIAFCKANNVKEPIWSSGDNTIAVCGLDYYNNDRITAWKNSLLMVTLKNSSLRQLKLSSDRRTITDVKTFLKDDYGRLRDVCVSPDGKVYICTSNGDNDKLIEISNLP